MQKTRRDQSFIMTCVLLFAGAVLLVLDSVGTTLARNITDASGSFRIATTPVLVTIPFRDGVQ